MKRLYLAEAWLWDVRPCSCWKLAGSWPCWRGGLCRSQLLAAWNPPHALLPAATGPFLAVHDGDWSSALEGMNQKGLLGHHSTSLERSMRASRPLAAQQGKEPSARKGAGLSQP